MRRATAACIGFALSAAVSLCAATPAAAADLALDEAPVELASEWSVKVRAYLWASALTGTAKPFAAFPPADIDLTFSDILDNLKFAGMAMGAAHRGRFGGAADVQYVALKSFSDAVQPAFGEAAVSVKLFIGTAVADYKVIDTERAELIASAGARVYWSETTVNLSPGNLPGIEGTGSDTWVDPMVGLRANALLTPKIFAEGWAYVGGFGIASDIAADLYAGVGYDFTDHVSATIGYRVLRVDRDTGGFVYDVTQHGPMAGIQISF